MPTEHRTITLPAPVGLYDPFVHAMVDDPYAVYRRLRAEHPLYHNEQRGFWTLSRWSDVQDAARDWGTFSSAEGVDIDITPQFFGPGDFIETDPPKHDRLRAVVRDVFSPRGVQRLERLVRAQVDALLDPLLEKGSGEFVGEVASRLPLGVILGILGFSRSDGDHLASLMIDVLVRVPGSADLDAGVLAARQSLEQYILETVDERRRSPRDDIVSSVVAAEKEGEVRPDEVTGICLTLLLAGWETTSVLATNAMWLLAHHPDQRRLLANAPERIPAAIEEILRFESPAQQHSRVVRRDTELHGETIPEGDRVVLLWGSANRDETRWPEADAFDVAREPKRNLAFGEGIHHCLGAPLARLEGRILLEQALGRCQDFHVGAIERLESVIIRGISRLPIAFER